jgi:hypothetical protein
MKKVDFKKDLKYLYKPSPKEVTIVNVPEVKKSLESDLSGPRGLGFPPDSWLRHRDFF